jgi:cysteine desulfurase
MASISAHKMYGPKGVGSLYVRKVSAWLRKYDEGGHEHGFSIGTLNWPALSVLVQPRRMAKKELAERSTALAQICRDRLIKKIEANLDFSTLNAIEPIAFRTSVNFSFAFGEGNLCCMACRDVALTSALPALFFVADFILLKAIGVPDRLPMAHSGSVL